MIYIWMPVGLEVNVKHARSNTGLEHKLVLFDSLLQTDIKPIVH